jgi:hypothetical protein
MALIALVFFRKTVTGFTTDEGAKTTEHACWSAKCCQAKRLSIALELYASARQSCVDPGWTREESDILRKALMKFGIGNWKEVIESGCLPGKTNAQMNLQLQRLLGQQSTAGIKILT